MKEKRDFTVRRYAVQTNRLQEGDSLRIALLSDLHGKHSRGLLEALAEEAPDLIAVCGDLVEKYLPPEEEDEYHQLMRTQARGGARFLRFLHRIDARFVGKRRRRASSEEENSHVFALLDGMARIAPVCYSPGNHERRMTEGELARIGASGAEYLSNREISLTLKGVEVAVGGCAILHDEEFLDGLSRGEGVRILLCHCPEYYPRLLKNRPYDLVLAGHAHGGQIRLFGRGVFAPGQGLFPKYDGGVYHGNFVVSRGLANTAAIPRLFNPRELCVITLAGCDAREGTE